MKKLKPINLFIPNSGGGEGEGEWEWDRGGDYSKGWWWWRWRRRRRWWRRICPRRFSVCVAATCSRSGPERKYYSEEEKEEREGTSFGTLASLASCGQEIQGLFWRRRGEARREANQGRSGGEDGSRERQGRPGSSDGSAEEDDGKSCPSANGAEPSETS